MTSSAPYSNDMSLLSLSVISDKSSTYRALCLASFCLSAKNIIRRVWKRLQQRNSTCSLTSSKIRVAPDLESSISRKSNKQLPTTMASNTFQKPPRKNRRVPTTRTRNTKSAKIRKFMAHSASTKNVVLLIEKPLIRVVATSKMEAVIRIK